MELTTTQAAFILIIQMSDYCQTIQSVLIASEEKVYRIKFGL